MITDTVACHLEAVCHIGVARSPGSPRGGVCHNEVVQLPCSAPDAAAPAGLTQRSSAIRLSMCQHNKGQMHYQSRCQNVSPSCCQRVHCAARPDWQEHEICSKSVQDRERQNVLRKVLTKAKSQGIPFPMHVSPTKPMGKPCSDLLIQMIQSLGKGPNWSIQQLMASCCSF